MASSVGLEPAREITMGFQSIPTINYTLIEVQSVFLVRKASARAMTRAIQ